MASNVISGHLNPQNAQNNQVPSNVKDYSPRSPPVVISNFHEVDDQKAKNFKFFKKGYICFISFVHI